MVEGRTACSPLPSGLSGQIDYLASPVDEEEFAAKIIGHDPKTDVALKMAK